MAKLKPHFGPQSSDRFVVRGNQLKVSKARRVRELAVLKAARRNKLSDSAFALPGRKYPIHDLTHAKNALSRVAQHGTPEEQKAVRAAVKRKYGKQIKAFRDSQSGTKELALAHDHPSSVHPDLPNKPGVTNWVERSGGLPSFIKRVAKHIMYDGGLSESHAIAAAVQQCRDGKFGAKGLAAYAQFRAKAAASRAKG